MRDITKVWKEQISDEASEKRVMPLKEKVLMAKTTNNPEYYSKPAKII